MRQSPPCTRRAHPCSELPAIVKPAALTALSNVILSMPAHAEAGKIFGEPGLCSSPAQSPGRPGAAPSTAGAP